MTAYRCCEHCADDPVHEEADGSQIKDTHTLPCDVLIGPWERCNRGRRVAQTPVQQKGEQ